MKEINIAKTITKKRHEKGITQDELAAYIGVSKASVSKWETGQSYPDIAFLPQLAAYFNISIDQLLDYSPQMTREDIRKLYQRLASDFGEKPFQEVLEEYQQIVKKYYSCFPLQLQMALLLLNHCNLATDEKQQTQLIDQIIQMCVRIKTESSDTDLSSQANSLHAMCCLLLHRPAETIELLDSFHRAHQSEDSATLSNAYLALGNVDKAKEILQICLYRGVISAVSSASSLLLLAGDDETKTKDIIQRTLDLICTFDLENLHIHTTLIFYLSAAKSSITVGQNSDALHYLELYTSLCCKLEYPVQLHGDDFFDHIEAWFKTFDLGANSPTEEMTIRTNILHGVTDDPIFAALEDEPRYAAILRQLTDNLKKEAR